MHDLTGSESPEWEHRLKNRSRKRVLLTQSPALPVRPKAGRNAEPPVISFYTLCDRGAFSTKEKEGNALKLKNQPPKGKKPLSAAKKQVDFINLFLTLVKENGIPELLWKRFV